MKSFLFLLTLLPCFLFGRIVKIENINDILSEIEPETLVLFDMDDTLTDSSISLGSGKWRDYLRETFPSLHDRLTHHVANTVSVTPIEENTPALVQGLQKQNIAVFVLTARGQEYWYSTPISNIDVLTNKQLKSAGFDFSLTVLPSAFAFLSSPHFKAGIIYSHPHKKGPFLKKLLKGLNYTPKKIVFIDDKKFQVESIEEAFKDSTIETVSFWYTHADQKHSSFNPAIAALQLKSLLCDKKILSDAEASLCSLEEQESAHEFLRQLALDPSKHLILHE